MYTLSFSCIVADIVFCFCESGHINIEVADQCSEKCPAETKGHAEGTSYPYRINDSANTGKDKCQGIPLMLNAPDHDAVRISPSIPETKFQKHEIAHPLGKMPFLEFYQKSPGAPHPFNTSILASITSTILII